LFTFSDTSRGPSNQNCAKGVSNFIQTTGSQMATAFWVFGVGLFLSAVFSTLLWKKEHHSLESPLLGK